MSKQGKKSMIIIPTKFYERLDSDFKDNDPTVEINLTFALGIKSSSKTSE
jgi:hypothetical protein